jgi:2-polyprenyl-3-methyl-5-hydroxy-6-metoxy-1,4-benzoquinol methylase
MNMILSVIYTLNSASNSSNLYKYITDCGSCQSSKLEVVYDFGVVPLAGYFPRKEEEDLRYLIPMQLLLCDNCLLAQITPDVADEILFSDYRYISSVGMQEHFNGFAEWFTLELNPSKTLQILEIGCNDGPLLRALSESGFNPVGIDPATNIVKIAQAKGFEIINDFFNESILDKYNLRNSQDVVISCNSFAHISGISGIAKAVSESLKHDGMFIVEVQSLPELIKSNSFDFIYHEHKYYYSIKSIEYLLKQYGLSLIDGMKINTHGGSYRLVFSKNLHDKSTRIKDMEKEESIEAITKEALISGIKTFMRQIELTRAFLRECKGEGKRVVGFGASGRANMLLHYLQEDASIIEDVFDESVERIGRNMGFTSIPIAAFTDLSKDKYDAMIILAWNYATTVLPKLPVFRVPIVIPLPVYKEVTK